MQSIRAFQAADIEPITRYWLYSDPVFLEGMGVDVAKIPAKADWEAMLLQQLTQSLQEKQSYCLIWESDGVAVGHSNVNKIIFGQEASMHLHLWESGTRQKGMGTAFVRMCLPRFFEDLQLKMLYCEPYSLNPAPNKTLEKVGFEFVREYVTTPGWINFEQPVKRWEIEKNKV